MCFSVCALCVLSVCSLCVSLCGFLSLRVMCVSICVLSARVSFSIYVFSLGVLDVCGRSLSRCSISLCAHCVCDMRVLYMSVCYVCSVCVLSLS